MADIVTVKVEGFDELEAKLYDLATKLARRIMREALRKAVQPWIDEISAGAARGDYTTGFMASQVDAKVTTSAREEAGTAMVGITTRQNPARTGHESDVPSASNEAYWKELGTIHEPARPFMRPAFEAMKDRVLAIFEATLRDLLKEVSET